MSYKINPKKLESCMVELFSELSWSNYIKLSGRLDIAFLTSDGQCIMFPTNFEPGCLCNWTTQSLRDGGENQIYKMMDKTILKSFNEAIGGMSKFTCSPPTHVAAVGWHSCILLWTFCLYLERYYKKEILKSNGKTPLQATKDILLDFVGITRLGQHYPNLGLHVGRHEGETRRQMWKRMWEESPQSLIQSQFLLPLMHNLEICRVIGISKLIDEKEYTPYWHEHDDLNIESHHTLTDPQRRFLLDVIKVGNISPDKIYIDDRSEEQCVKRQLRLHSIVAQFHT